MGISAWIFCEYRYESGTNWVKMAEFEIGSARRLHQAIEKSGVGKRGLPDDTCGSIQNVHEELRATSEDSEAEGIFDTTWLFSEELHLIQNAQHWLSDNELGFVPPYAYEGYAEIDTVQAWQAFARAHVSNGHPVRFVFRFA